MSNERGPPFLPLPLGRGRNGAREMSNNNPNNLIAAIDDDSDMLELVKMVLFRGGYDVIGTSNSMNAEAMIEEAQPGVVLLDLMMPQMDGWQVFEALKANPATKDIPI